MIPGHFVNPAHPHEGVIQRGWQRLRRVFSPASQLLKKREQATVIVDQAEGRGMVLLNHIIKAYVRSVMHKLIEKLIKAGIIE